MGPTIPSGGAVSPFWALGRSVVPFPPSSLLLCLLLLSAVQRSQAARWKLFSYLSREPQDTFALTYT